MGGYGLLGERLGHSFSPRIHSLLGGYDYRLIEVAPSALDGFMRAGQFDGLNVTIPYKKAVVPYCAQLSPRAQALGNVNTIVRRPDGSLYGDNTDYCGFETLVRTSGIDVRGAKCAVLGSGGASCTAQAVLRDLGAARVLCISRRGTYNYTDITPWAGTEILVNATPVGMYPNNGTAPVDLAALPRCRAVFDLIYNPARTALMLDAEARQIPAFGGLLMLVAQARAAAELFTGAAIDDSRVAAVVRQLAAETGNVILIGMPGCGKSSVGAALARRTGRTFVDADDVFAQTAGISIPLYFKQYGEAAFRSLETRVLEKITRRSGLVIATGGGVVTRPENRPLLRQNGTVIWLRRPVVQLPTDGRPMSQKFSPAALYAAREPLYRAWSDYSFDNDAVLETAEHIQKELNL